MKDKLILLFIILLAIIPRLLFLSNVPNAITQDELHYALDVKSFQFSGKDVLQQVTPLDVVLFNFPKSEPLQAELPYFLQMPIFFTGGFSMVNLVIPNVVIGILTVLMLYLVTGEFFNKRTALIAAILASINPWMIFISRTGYEAGIAPFFFLLTLFVLLKAKDNKILLAIPVSLLAFYSYIGTKIIFIPIMVLFMLYVYFFVNKRKFRTQYIAVFIFTVLITLLFFIQFKHFSLSRNDEFLLPSNPEIVRQVVSFRQATIQNPFLSVFDNKYLMYATVLTKNAFNALSFNYLFTGADYFFMLGVHGLFYYIDGIFLVIGTVFIYLKNRKVLGLLAAAIFLGILPQVFHNPDGNGNFAPHLSLAVPFLIILVAVGLDAFLSKFKKDKLYLATAAILVVYTLAFINFMYIYFYKFPIQEGTFEVQNRILAKYLSLQETNNPITVYSTNAKLAFREYVFYQNLYTSKTSSLINSDLENDKFVYKNIMFRSCNPNIKETSALTIVDLSCTLLPNLPSVKIVQLKDSGNRYFIYNDKVCKKYGLKNYVSDLKLSDFSIENLSSQKFCQAFIISN